MAIRPFSFFKSYNTTPAVKAPSAQERIQSLQNERAQLEQEAERLGLSTKDPNSPLVVSHQSIVATIDAELEMLTKRQEQGAKPVSQSRETAQTEQAAKTAQTTRAAKESAPKQVIRRMPDKNGVYPPGTFLDIYA